MRDRTVTVRVDEPVIFVNQAEANILESIRTFVGGDDPSAEGVCTLKKHYEHCMAWIVLRAVHGAAMRYRTAGARYQKNVPDVYTPVDDTTSVLSEGVRFLEDDRGRRLGVQTAPSQRYGHLLLNIHCRREHLDAAETFLREVHREMGELRGLVLNSDGESITLDRAYRWDDLIAPREVVCALRRFVEEPLRRRQEFEKHRVPLKRGVLLYGPPGNGKTLTCRILAGVCGVNVIHATMKDMPPFQESIVGEVYELARAISPCIVVWEDVDIIGADRSGAGGITHVLADLLNELDGFERNHNIVTLATTNREEVMDEALANRPGRFDLKLRFGNPDTEQRIRLLRLFTRDYAVDEDVRLEDVAARLEGCSGAHVREAVQRSVVAAMERGEYTGDDRVRVTRANLDAAIVDFKQKGTFIGFGK
jgi:AAA+ superfamily predicted ATPase